MKHIIFTSSIVVLILALLLCSSSLAQGSSLFKEAWKAQQQHLRPQRQRLSSSSCEQQDATTMGLSVKSFGAVGDGKTQDAVAIQRAINAAQTQGRTLLFPAGRYLINTTLSTILTKPLRILGEGRDVVSLVASPPASPPASSPASPPASPPASSSSPPIFAILNITWSGEKKESTHVDMEHLTFDAAGKRALFCVYAPGLTRSFWNQCNFYSAKKHGAVHGGWINTISECAFNGNGDPSDPSSSGLLLDGAANSVVVSSSSFESGNHHGMVVRGGTSVIIERCCIEGNTGAGIIASAVHSLRITAAYFEENLINSANALVYNNKTTQFYADIVLSGAGDPTKELSGAYPVVAATVESCTFAPHTNRLPPASVPIAAVAAVGVRSANFVGNTLLGGDNFALVVTGANLTYWIAENIRIKDTAGCGTTAADGRGDTGAAPTCIVLSNPNQERQQSLLYSWEIEDISALTQYVAPVTQAVFSCSSASPPPLPPNVPEWKQQTTGGAALLFQPSPATFNYGGRSTCALTLPSNTSWSSSAWLEWKINLAESFAPHQLLNVPMYLAVPVFVPSPLSSSSFQNNNKNDVVFALGFDLEGDGNFVVNSDWYQDTNVWRISSTQFVLKKIPKSGTISVGIRLEGPTHVDRTVYLATHLLTLQPVGQKFGSYQPHI